MKIKMILFWILIIFFVLIGYFFIGKAVLTKKPVFGVNFSQKYAYNLKLDWRKNYLALLDDLLVKDIKLITHWDLIESEEDKFYFDDLDWQIKESEKRNVSMILVIGMKTGRWPECHIPEWAKGLSKEQQQEKVLSLIEKIILRYKDSSSIMAWQIENEALFPFGECPWTDKEFFKKEIALARALDSERKIIISDTGEGSFWTFAAKTGDMVGITIYRKVWFKELRAHITYPFPPVFYWRKAQLIKNIFKKDIICIELQAEPWCQHQLYNCSLKEQEKTMNFEQFKSNIEFAKATGLSKFYLWGSEWWYWLKEKQNQPNIWQEAKKLF